MISGLVSDLAFCNGEIDDARADIARAERRIEFYEREIARIEELIAKASK